jgi:hypothetical protein
METKRQQHHCRGNEKEYLLVESKLVLTQTPDEKERESESETERQSFPEYEPGGPRG